MKKTGKLALSVITKTIAIILVVVLLPYAKLIFGLIVPGIRGEIVKHSEIIEKKLESSQRLEVTTVNEEGILHADTKVIIFGKVGSTTIKYRYTASIGVDLKKVILTEDTDRIIIILPEFEVLNDGIEALDVSKNDFFSYAIDTPPEVLLAEQRKKCREQIFADREQSQTIREHAVKAFHETICQWLEGNGERHYEIEIRFSDETTTG